MATRRKLDEALDYGRQLQSVHELQAAGNGAAADDILAILDVSEVDADAQPKKITLQELVNAGGGQNAAGSTTEIQYNTAGSLDASPDLTWDDTTKELTVGGDVNLDDGGTYTTTFQLVTPTANRVIAFPDATGTVALVGGASGQVTYNSGGALAGSSALTFDPSVGLRTTLRFGYGTGAGGTVTQATNKSTGVTLNVPCGQITMSNANLVAGTAVSFVLTNDRIEATDLLIINHSGGGTAGAYMFGARPAAGSCTITVRNITAGDLAEAVVVGFAIIKSVTA